MRLILALFILSSPALHAAEELTFSEVYASKAMGIDKLPNDELAILTEKVREYANYRKNPKSSSGQQFASDCAADPKINILCELVINKIQAAPSQPAPADIRAKLNTALLSLDIPNERTKNCVDAVKTFETVLQDQALYTYHTRALYWSWVCAKNAKDQELARKLKEKLWEGFPLTHQTLRILDEDKDQRLNIILQTEKDWIVRFRSEKSPELNEWIESIEALQKIGEDGAAAVAASYINSRLRDLEPEVRLYFAVLMSQVAESVPSVLPVSRVLVPLFIEHKKYIAPATLKLLFPINYSFEKVTQEKAGIVELVDEFRGDLDPALLLGLIHQESAFNPRASSQANAYGLTQLLLETATDQYKKLKKDPNAKVDKNMLYQPRLSVQLGILDFRWRLAQLNGDLVLTLASYNAGVAGVQKWVKESKKVQNKDLLADVLFLNRPVEFHVAQYVTMILSRADWYQKLYPQFTSARR